MARFPTPRALADAEQTRLTRYLALARQKDQRVAPGLARQFVGGIEDGLQLQDEVLGGIAAEEVVYQETSTGAQNDLERATDLARRMVTEFGMSDRLGPLAFGKRDELVFLGREIAHPFAVDATDPAAVRAFLEDVDSFLSAVPYWLNPAIARVAIEARASMTDLGGNTDLVRAQLLLDPEAESAGIAMIPDCGQVPGMGTSLTAYAISLLDETDEVTFWDGGNPLHPEPPFNYILTFNIAGLTNEYYGVAHFLRDGKRVEVPTFLEDDYEIVDFPAPIGRMEAFVAGGGTSTMPWTFEGKLKTLWNKTLRWPGHFAAWKAYMDAGLLETDPVDVGGVPVVPRDLLHAVLDPKIRAKPGEPDLVIVDSIQTVYLPEMDSAAGSVSQVRESAVFSGIPLVERLKAAGYYQGVTHKLHVAPVEKFPYDEFIEGQNGKAVADFLARASKTGKPWHLFFNISVSHRPFPNSDQVKMLRA